MKMIKTIFENLRSKRKIITEENRPIWYEVPPEINVKSRVMINGNSGFSKWHKGTVSFIQPNGIIWVKRDRSSCDMFFYPYELTPLVEVSN